MPVEKLLAEHRRILRAIDGIERVIAGPHPTGPGLLMEKRWEFTRELLLHFSRDESLVLVPLMSDARADVAAAAARSRVELGALYRDFRAHVTRWKGFPGPEHWDEYCLVTATIMQRIRTRLADEESGVYAMMPVRSGGTNVEIEKTNYAGEAWPIRDVIYPPNGAPLPASRPYETAAGR